MEIKRTENTSKETTFIKGGDKDILDNHYYYLIGLTISHNLILNSKGNNYNMLIFK